MLMLMLILTFNLQRPQKNSKFVCVAVLNEGQLEIKG